MIPLRLFFLFVLPVSTFAAGVPSSKTPATAPHPTLADRSAVVKQRIDALFKIRTDPPPFAADGPNPFHLASDVRPVDAPTQPLAAARVDLERPLTDAELLPRLAAGLRMGGVMELGDAKPRVIINQRPFREGDVISVSYQELRLKLLVKSLDTERLVLALNDTEVVIRLKKSR